MRYVLARFEQQQRDEAYRICVSDSLRIITENTAGLVGGKYYNLRYYDIIHPPKRETRTADEVIDRIKMGLSKLGGENG